MPAGRCTFGGPFCFSYGKIPAHMNRKWALIAGVLFGLPLLAVLSFVIFQPVKVLPRMQLAPGYALTDQDGRTITSEDARGAITLYSFTYAQCGEECPPAIPRLRELQQALAERPEGGVPVRLVTVTVDPERDTPEALRAFGQRAGADFSRWSFVTGDGARLRQTVGSGFGLFYAPQSNGTIEFDQRMVLVDGWGLVRAEYPSHVPPLERLLRDIRLITDEVQNSQGMAKYVYEAAHLFACYAP